MHSVWTDLRYAVRVFSRHPGITFVAILSLGLGMGANSTIFSLVDGMFLRPLPVRDPAGLLWVTGRTAESRQSGISWLDYRDLGESAGAFADVAAQSRRAGLLEGPGEAELVLLTVVSDNYFSLLGVEAARGRLFRPDLDTVPEREPAIVISDSLWRRRFGADPSLVGRAIRMNNGAFTVVGVLPPEFRGLERAVRNDVWAPLSTWKAMGGRQEFESRRPGQVEALARLREGVTIDQAQAQLDALSSRLEQDYPATHRGRRFLAASEEARRTERGLKPSVLLLSIVGLLVLIACVNVAVLLLAQAESRRRETSVRLALGASRRRLARQLLTEGALLGLLGGAAALLVTRWMIPLLPALLPPGPDFIRFDIRLDGRVLMMTLLTCAVTVLVFGLAPAIEASRTDLNGVLKSGGWETRRRFAGRSLLVAGQAALSVVLVAAAGLLARSFLYTEQQRPGFDTGRNMLVLVAAVARPQPRLADTCDEISERIRALPGVRQAAYCRRMPLSGSGGGATRDVIIPGFEAPPGTGPLRIRYNQVSPEYFAVTGTRLLTGRALTRSGTGAARVALVNQTMAQLYWPKGNAVGQWIRVDNADTEIAGVVEDAAIVRIHEPPEPFLYFPFAQMPSGEATFLAETAGEPGALLDAVKREMRSVNPDLRLLMTSSLKQHVRDALYSDWLPAVLSATIGALGMFLAAAGLFGVVMHGVNRRRRELGIRLAIGARRIDLVTMVLRHGLVLAGSGAVVGIALALGAGRLMSSLLYGVSPYDPLTLALSIAAVLAVALIASLYPAWKATRVDPAAVLRIE
ncbi:MAG: ABC transporter permease [Acidobacteria bacterium]|nr:ABC transporter permease [Acidobacteriota bacterium]